MHDTGVEPGTCKAMSFFASDLMKSIRTPYMLVIIDALLDISTHPFGRADINVGRRPKERAVIVQTEPAPSEMLASS